MYIHLDTYIYTYTHTAAHSLQDMEEKSKKAFWLNEHMCTILP